jgi:4-amino-4-deoxy-L-arabinose transferase-like glycosyltransferase
MKNKLSIFFLSLIVIFGAFLYFYKISSIPNSVYDDEATIGYNAYSILTTLKDEYGKFLPIAFRFFGAYTPPLYVYLTIPLIKLFGVTAFSIRFLSAISTLFGIIIIYFFIKEFKIFKNPWAKIIGSLLFAILPWTVFNARLGYEVTLGYITFAAASLFLWQGIKQQKISLLAIFLFSISTYIAHTERYLVPIFLFLFLIIFRKSIFIKKNKHNLSVSLLIILLTQIPNLFLITTKAFWVKNSSINTNLFVLFSDLVNQILIYFSPKTLFGLTPDINLQHSIPYQSFFYSWMVIPFFIGLYLIFKNIQKPEIKYLLLLFLTAPIPGSLSGHFISVQRVLTLIIPMILIISLGIDFISQKIKPIFSLPLFSLLIIFSLILLWRGYFIFLPKQRATWWSYGYGQLSEIITQKQGKKFIIDNGRTGSIYMLILYYTKYSPQNLQSQFSSEFIKNYYSNPPFNPNYNFGNTEIRPINWKDDTLKDVIIVGDPLAISDQQATEHCLTKEFEIKDPLGKTVITGYQTNPKRKIPGGCITL